MYLREAHRKTGELFVSGNAVHQQINTLALSEALKLFDRSLKPSRLLSYLPSVKRSPLVVRRF